MNNKKMVRLLALFFVSGWVVSGEGSIAQAQVVNGGFESGSLTGWNNNGNARIVSGGISGGSYTVSVGSGDGGVSQEILSKVSVGKSYRFRAYARTGSSSDLGGYVGIKFKNGSTEILKKSFRITTTGYQAYSADIVVPSNATSAQVYVWKNAGSSRVYADNFSLVAMVVVPTPTPAPTATPRPSPSPTPAPSATPAPTGSLDPEIAKRLIVRHEYVAGQSYSRWWTRIHGDDPIPRGSSIAVTSEYGLPALVFKYPKTASWSSDNMRRAQLKGMRTMIDSSTTYKITEGTTRYQGLRIRMPAPHSASGSFLNIFSHTTDRGSSGAQNLGLPNSKYGTPGLYMMNEYGGGPTLGPVPHPGDRWIDVITRVTYWQSFNGNGVVEYYWKWSNETTWTKAGSNVGETFGSPTSANEHRIGIYSGSGNSDYVVAFSKIIIGTSFNDVAAALGVMK